MKYKGITIHKNTKCDTWYTRFRKNDKQYYVSARTQQECLQKLKSKLKEKPENIIKQYTFIEWYNEWYELYKNNKIKETTKKQYEFALNHISEKIKNKKLKEISTNEILYLINGIEKTRAKQKVFEFIKTIFAKAKIHNIIDHSIIDIIEKPAYKRERGEILTDKQYKSFENICIEQKEHCLLVILYQGLRIGECLALCKNDIDFENKTININKSFSNTNEFDTTKNKQSNRIMPMFEKTFEILKFTKIEDKRIFKTSQKALREQFRKIKEKCDIKQTFRIHDLRHTFITKCKDMNIPEHIIQSWVGHEIGSNITRKVYTHINETTNKEYIEVLNENSTQILLTKNND